MSFVEAIHLVILSLDLPQLTFQSDDLSTELRKHPVDGFSAGLVDDDNLLEWDIMIMGCGDFVSIFLGCDIANSVSFCLSLHNAYPSSLLHLVVQACRHLV